MMTSIVTQTPIRDMSFNKMMLLFGTRKGKKFCKRLVYYCKQVIPKLNDTQILRGSINSNIVMLCPN